MGLIAYLIVLISWLPVAPGGSPCALTASALSRAFYWFNPDAAALRVLYSAGGLPRGRSNGQPAKPSWGERAIVELISSLFERN